MPLPPSVLNTEVYDRASFARWFDRQGWGSVGSADAFIMYESPKVNSWEELMERAVRMLGSVVKPPPPPPPPPKPAATATAVSFPLAKVLALQERWYRVVSATLGSTEAKRIRASIEKEVLHGE